jgi:hypothetical protein
MFNLKLTKKNKSEYGKPVTVETKDSPVKDKTNDDRIALKKNNQRFIADRVGYKNI